MISQRCIVLGLVLGVKVFAGETQHPISDNGIQTSDDCHNACTELVNVMGEMASYNSIPDDFFASFYTTRQSDVIPACVIRPLTPEDVSVVVKTISKHSCHFAIKSGGHSMFAGASNADGGITIDLKHLNGLELSKDLSTARVGTANRWGDVYGVLEPLGLVVVGGRVGHVGVGGFTLGGGISFLSRKYGWASDNVRNYEIVLANGSIANVNYESHPDLYWALRGGTSNFGIVTRFDLEVYQQGPVWGTGAALYAFSDNQLRFASLNLQRPFSFSIKYMRKKLGHVGNSIACFLGKCTTSTAMLQAFENMILKEKDTDPYLQFYMSICFWPRVDVIGASILQVHSEPVENPPAFKEVRDLGPAIYGTAKIQNLSDMVKELDQYNVIGYRMIFHEITLRYNATIFSQVIDIWIQEVEQIAQVPGLFPTLVVQPISQIASVGVQKNGGNPFGFTGDDGPIFALLACPRWDNAADDDEVNAAVNRFFDKTVALAKEKGLLHPWIYPNYANKGQDVYAGFGEENRKKLKKIQKKYDPEGIFDKLQPENFKV